MKRLQLFLVAALLVIALPACATARAGFRVAQAATAEARVYLKADGDFTANSNILEWAYLKGEGRYEVGYRWVDPLTGTTVAHRVLSGEGKVESGWRLTWDDEVNRPTLVNVGYEAAHAALGDPPAKPPE